MNILRLNKKVFKNFNGKKLVIGKSVFGHPILCYGVIKTPYPKAIIQASIHAREYITAYLTLKLISDFYKNGKQGSIYFIPIANPDGVEIALNKDGLYKANARGVDLNVNFDARWSTGSQNVKKRASENYIGEKPFSEPETMALRDFTLKIKPDYTISYHSKGQEIYYEFFQKDCACDLAFAKEIAQATGYQIKKTPNSAGGYKDWCIQELKIPSLTIEVGDDKLSHPIKKAHLREIYKQNKGIIEKANAFFVENKWK